MRYTLITRCATQLLLAATVIVLGASNALAQGANPILAASITPTTVAPGGAATLTLTLTANGATGLTADGNFTAELPLPLQLGTNIPATEPCADLLAVSGHDQFSATLRSAAGGNACPVEIPIVWPINGAVMCGPDSTIPIFINGSENMLKADGSDHVSPTFVQLSCSTPYTPPAGPQGEKGDVGDQGVDGANGADGAQGQTGLQGPKGADATPEMCTAAEAKPVPTLSTWATLLLGALLLPAAAWAKRRQR